MTKAHPKKLVGIQFDVAKDADVIERIYGQHSIVGYIRKLVRQDMQDDGQECENVVGDGYVELPKDADGEYIRIGDVMEWPTTGETFEVVGIGDGTLFYVENGSECADWTGATTKRHYHAPTVEDVLCELLDKVDDDRAGQAEIIAEYAAKLQLRGDAE